MEKRNNYGILSGVFGIIINVLLGIIKLIIGLISNSISILADGINNLFDTTSSIITLIGFKLSTKKPNKKHPYGYARYEYISGFIVSMLMIVMGLTLIKESIIKIINPEIIIISRITYLVLFISVIGKLMLLLVYKNFEKKTQSKTIKANIVDTKNDIITTISIIISMIIMNIFKINIDGLVGIFISIFIIYSAIKMTNEVLEPIIGIIPSKEKVEKIEKQILSYNFVLGIHDLVIHNYGIYCDYVTIHVEIDSNMDMILAHDLIDKIENDFKEKYNINLTIHMDPVIVGNEKVEKIKNKIIKVINELDKDLSIHDFRIVEGKKYTNILFDCVIPFEKEYTIEEIKKILKRNIKSKNKIYNYMIEIDRPYV